MKIFVFGSNLAGRHGKGSALEARKNHGAIYGQGIGMQGNSYAIPTKDKDLKILPLHKIKPYIDDFIDYAKNNPKLIFHCVAIGCGLAGYSHEQMAPLFKNVPRNVILIPEWVEILNKPCPGYAGRDENGSSDFI
jgi:hypothetical protein